MKQQRLSLKRKQPWNSSRRNWWQSRAGPQVRVSICHYQVCQEAYRSLVALPFAWMKQGKESEVKRLTTKIMAWDQMMIINQRTLMTSLGWYWDIPTLKHRKCLSGSCFQQAYGKKTYESRVQKYGSPDSHWSRCPDLDTVVVANLPTDTVRMDLKAKRLHSFWCWLLDSKTSRMAELIFRML